MEKYDWRGEKSSTGEQSECLKSFEKKEKGDCIGPVCGRIAGLHWKKIKSKKCRPGQPCKKGKTSCSFRNQNYSHGKDTCREGSWGNRDLQEKFKVIFRKKKMI